MPDKTGASLGQFSSVVEQRFCKPSVVGSNPTTGSSSPPKDLQRIRLLILGLCLAIYDSLPALFRHEVEHEGSVAKVQVGIVTVEVFTCTKPGGYVVHEEAD